MKNLSLKKLLAAVLLILTLSSFVACNKSENEEKTAGDPTTAVTETAPVETETPTETEAVSEITLKESYEPYKAFDENDTEKTLNDVYGTGIQYGGSLTFSEGNKFNLAVGVTNGKTTGTYEFTGEKEITLTYENDTTLVVEVISVEDGVATEIKVPKGNFQVYFR